MADAASPLPLPDIAHLFSTTVLDRSDRLSLSIMTTPARTLDLEGEEDISAVAQALGLELVAEVPQTSDDVLPAVLASVARGRDRDAVMGSIDRLLSPPEPMRLAPSLAAFVQHCVDTPIVGVEESPLSAKTLRTIVTAAGAIGVAAITTGSGLIVAIVATVATIVVISATVMAVEYVAEKIEQHRAS